MRPQDPQIREKAAPPPGMFVLLLTPWGKLLGYLSPDHKVLHLPLVLETAPQEQPGGDLGVMRGSHPIEYLESIRSIPAPPGSTAIPVDTLDPEDRAALEKAAAVGGAIAEMLRRKKSRLVVAGAIPPGVPLNGGRKP